MHMLEMAREHNATFIQASTSECYGDPAVHPQPETYWGNVNPIGPRSVYDEAKRFSEAAVMAYHRYHGLRTRTVRIFNTYGPRLQANDGRVISEFLNQALQGKPLTIYGDGSQTRSFCYVSDLVEGILRLSDSEEVMPVNLGNPDEWTILECAREVQSLIPKAPGIVFQALPQDDPTRRKPDITKATTLLNWKPAVNLREGLAETLTYFREQLNRNPSAVQAST
jgi:dTDP-glucose 4,6-dehydratase